MVLPELPELLDREWAQGGVPTAVEAPAPRAALAASAAALAVEAPTARAVACLSIVVDRTHV